MSSSDPSGRAELARLIADAQRVVIFTGAGISTESGIPDFRSPGGVWSKMKPIYFQDFVASEERRREAWERAFTGRAGWVGREPNAGHMAVARLVASGKASAVITQNVDNLHQASGVPSERIIELHGNASYAACLECGLRHELEELKALYQATGDLPACRDCDGIVKTATISFGQAMPAEPMARAEAETLACDLFLVLGSSLVVYPAAGFPIMAKRNGARLAIVNREATELDPYADFVLHDEIGPVMTAAAPAN
ncbi:MAG: NAD-dependent deacetylase [Phenylobacterium sp. RIFCSPHIGHO2_01_FULL_69_31]|uniref:SIR2 family NAD-dependent protein deacylase n=1 Tax=Phenylobacterium sp. RIFCSPHIGHO2_01_FULL_69_31 TaxID=1801944 RepID=UPI0008B030C9|nr:Sir2 family NAD-dependent protein deacetylase [Phenylobacterium sp. RIFCSPHIGHO2_01_FULL_69_31]OHB29773.1 MAG: NAD-dependent deacetylase [Phenylobacterium sp. RIFCSPHIGHO2_01_FULL_69_31]